MPTMMEELPVKMMVNRTGEHLRLQLSESMDIGTIQEAKDKLAPLLEMGRDMVVDLSTLEEIDSAGMQLLILFKREARRRGIECRFERVAPVVAECLDFFHLREPSPGSTVVA